MFRTRQAPSPTGFLHIGTARTVLFTKLLAMAEKGVYFIRIDDTDRNRLMPESVGVLLKALDTIGLSADEGVTLEEVGKPDEFYKIYQKGDLGPYIQSERLGIYHVHAQKLLDKGLVYWNYLTESEKQELQEIKQSHKRPINYFKENHERYGLELMQTSLKQALNDPRKPALAYKLQRDSKFTCFDELLGKTEFDLSLEEDYTLLKSDGFPTYHLAHLVDDNLMQTSLVVRSQEWYPSIIKHQVAFEEYWGESPKYLHLPFILGETGNKKMSKRDGNVNLQDYLDKGYLPEAIINYLAFLGWNPGTEKELYLGENDFNFDSSMSLEFQIKARLARLIEHISQDFSLEKLSKSPARFNLEKLNWFNRQFIQMMSLEEFSLRSKLASKSEDSSSNIDGKSSDQEIISTPVSENFLAWNLDKNRATLLTEIGTESQCILDWQKPDLELVKWKKISLEESLQNLSDIQPIIVELTQKFEPIRQDLLKSVLSKDVNGQFFALAALWETHLKEWLTSNEKDTGSYLWPLRTALSGKAKSPSPFEMLAILTLEEVQLRLALVIQSR